MLSFLTAFAIFSLSPSYFFFFFNDTATTEIYTLSLHDALPISSVVGLALLAWSFSWQSYPLYVMTQRSEEHTSELQSQSNLVCRLLLEKKKKKHRAQLRSRLPEQRLVRSAPGTEYLTHHAQTPS